MTGTRQRLGRATFILAGVGATLGSALDAIHSHFGAISYTHPWSMPVRCALLGALFVASWGGAGGAGPVARG